MADTDNDQVDGTPEPKEPEVQSGNEPQYSDVEMRAMEQGWVPEDQWSGAGKWRSAEDFLDRGELFSKIDEVKRRAERAERVLEDLKKHHKQVRETEFKRALASLKAEKAQALENGDSVRVVEIDEEIADTKAAQQKIATEEQNSHEPEAPNPVIVAWINRNSWYGNEKAMKVFADTVAQEMAAAGERNPTKILEEVERQVKKEFPHKFTNPKRTAPGAVEGGGGKGKSAAKDDFQLTPEETQVMNRLVNANVMTKEKYIAEIKATRGA